jgi:hypothetical protein
MIRVILVGFIMIGMIIVAVLPPPVGALPNTWPSVVICCSINQSCQRHNE